jgi:hypothetical protein
LKVKIREPVFKVSLSIKLVRPHLNQQLGTMMHACHPRYTGGMNRRIEVQTILGKNLETLPAN